MVPSPSTVRIPVADDVRLARETIRLFAEAKEWLDLKSASVTRTLLASGEHVAVVLPTGIRAEFVAFDMGDYEQGIILAVDELR